MPSVSLSLIRRRTQFGHVPGSQMARRALPSSSCLELACSAPCSRHSPSSHSHEHIAITMSAYRPDGMAEMRRSGSSSSRRSSAGSTDTGRVERRRHRSSNLSSASSSSNAGRYSPSQSWYSPTSSPALHSPSSSSFTSVDSASTALTLPSPEVPHLRVLMILLDTHHPLIADFVEPQSVKEFVLEMLFGLRDELGVDLSCLLCVALQSQVEGLLNAAPFIDASARFVSTASRWKSRIAWSKCAPS